MFSLKIYIFYSLNYTMLFFDQHPIFLDFLSHLNIVLIIFPIEVYLLSEQKIKINCLSLINN